MYMLKSFPKYVKLLFFLTDGIRLLSVFKLGSYCAESVLTFLIPNVLHLSTQIIKTAHDDHFENALTKC